MNKLKDWQVMMMSAGMIFVLIGVGCYFFHQWAAYVVYGVGVLMFVPMQLMQRYEGSNFILRRLRRMQIISDVLFLLTGMLMYLNGKFILNMYIRNEWMLALTVATILQLYTAFRIPAELDKDK
ncbi:MAG: hypothetical protein J6M59_09150 [Bacteroidaceae bacterium]|jgi:hypothetical protein|nr:hypothetical protein [Bacteroidaceae bacterium]MBP5221297.1 hypothetical protein [Bacteroidaceae bacterium]MBQ5351557.1 hypothetical protein [Bacteroidaceae bacterium]MBQ5476844.1 hypothetical protein [Bacteroidaceae bacterium]MBQ7483458.1 hypothetical protein [Bacteroidaceae bacterium]